MMRKHDPSRKQMPYKIPSGKNALDIKQLLLVDKYDKIHHATQYALSSSDERPQRVYVAPSRICSGRGLFAAEDIPRNTPITAYAGKYTRMNESDHDTDYAYTIGCDDYCIDGSKPGKQTWCKYGVAQLCNDAIHPDVSGLSNNCAFEEVCTYIGKFSRFDTDQHDPTRWKPRVFLVSTRDIGRGEELLVSYGLPYWLYLRKYDEEWVTQNYGPDVYSWIMAHNKTRDLVRKNVHKKAELVEFIGCIEETEDMFYVYGKYRYITEFPTGQRPCCRSHARQRICMIDICLQRHQDIFYDNPDLFDTIHNDVTPNAFRAKLVCARCGRCMSDLEMMYD